MLTMAAWYKGLHGRHGPVPDSFASNESYDVLKSIKFHALNRYFDSEWALGDDLALMVRSALAEVERVCVECEPQFRGTRWVVLVQGDPTEGNVFFWPPTDVSEGKVVLIDWEFARWDLPEFDLAFFMDTYDLEESEQARFLRAYGYSFDPSSILRLSIVWLIHIFRIVAWRAERIALLRGNRLPGHLTSANEGRLVDGILGGVRKARRQIAVVRARKGTEN